MESSQLKDRNHLFCRERFSLSISMHTSGYEAYLAVSMLSFSTTIQWGKNTLSYLREVI